MNITQIKADINFLARSTSASYPDTDKIRNVNISYQDIARLIWESADGWQFDDKNATTLPVARGSLVHSQQDYTLPPTSQRIHEIAIMDKGGAWIKLMPIDWADMTQAPLEFMKGIGLPVYYDLVGNSVMMYPIPSSAACTLTSGLAVYVERDVTEFVVTASSATPGFATAFHRILSLAAALDFEQDDSQRRLLIAQKARLESGLTRFYSKRGVEIKSTMKPAGKKRWRQYT